LTRPTRLDEGEIAARLRDMPEWSLDGAKLHRRFGFADFSEAFAWMTRVALAAETMNHHPEWRNVYNRVDVHLTTHDAGGISELDFELARKMDRLAGS
jgi:4a-hydroxytetrahydrobiopterin dehydratase